MPTLFRVLLRGFGPLLLTGVLLSLPLPAVAQDEPDLLRIGREVYRHGLLADGTPVTARVMGDVEVSGDQFTCSNCHRRSGMGGAEGAQIVLAVNGPSLLTPRVNLYLERPAYTLDSFAAALLLGVNPAGQSFAPIMPRYDLPELETRALFAYLQTLSSNYSPGVDDENLHLATVVSADADPGQRQAMLAVIEAYFKLKNAQFRNERRRSESGPFFQAYRNKAYRHWVHHVWELTGPPPGWPAQLAAYERKQPVFALVSGLVNGPWAPVAAFCRERQLPCILPNTDLPPDEAATGFYTLYYSRGLTLEAQVLDAAMTQAGLNRVVQVARAGSAGEAGAATLRSRLQQRGVAVTQGALPEDAAGWQALKDQLAGLQPEALVLWLGADDLKAVAAANVVTPGAAVYLSSSLLDGNLEAVPQALRKPGRAVHPFLLPEAQAKRFVQTASWLKNSRLELTHPRLQGQTFYACLLLTGGLAHIRQNFYRDYLLDVLDHRDNMAVYSGNYPRLSFGPGQRFLAKGAYVVDLGSGASRWIVPGM